MRPKSLLLLALALGCGLVASIGISQIMERNSRPQASFETVPIYVAKHNINLGDPIEEAMLSFQEWPKDKVPRGAISDLKELEGRRPRSAIIEGEPILDGKLLAPGQIADPIRSIAAGMRLKTIAVDAEKSAAGLLGPGDRVDVQLFVKADSRNNITQAQSKVILQNIRVFAVDSTVQRSPDGGEEKTIAKTVSLMLTPEQASKLTLAENLGVVSLIPRNPDDESVAEVGLWTPDDLLGRGDQSNSRAREQGREDVAKDEPKVDDDNLATVVANTEPPPEPPFMMEVIERDTVHLLAFDSKTGKPIRDTEASTAKPGPSVNSPSGGVTHGKGGSASSADPQKKLDEFPIDFDDGDSNH
jgi:pilus assembly protein CpaB